MKHGFIGFGNVATALYEGLSKNEQNTFCYISATNRHTHIPSVPSCTDLVQHSDVVWFCVKPQQLDEVLEQLSGVDLRGKTVVSTIAGKRIAVFEEALGKQATVIRTMPNLAIAYQKSITAVRANRQTEGTDNVIAALAQLGEVVALEDERHFDDFTAIFGSGPAFILLALQAFQQQIASLGIPDERANTLLAELLAGTSEYLKENYRSFSLEQLIDRVTSKGGTTEAGIKSFHANSGETTLVAMLVAAALRSRELSE